MPKRSQQRNSPRGGVLIIVLVVVSLLTLACDVQPTHFHQNVATKLVTRQAQARALADSGVELIQRFMTCQQKHAKKAVGISIIRRVSKANS